MYRRFGGKREFKKYLRGRSDEGARLLFKFRSGTHGLNEELGRHSDRDGRVECTLCGAECESVVHVLWECSSYSTCRDNFQEALKHTTAIFVSLYNVQYTGCSWLLCTSKRILIVNRL